MIDEIAFSVAEARTYGPEVYALFRTLKAAFDPEQTSHPEINVGPQNVRLAHDLKLG